MTREEFWALLDHCRCMDTDLFLSALENEITTLPTDAIKHFHAYLTSYLDTICGCSWLSMACKVLNGCTSDDSALYFMLWVIAQGEECLTAFLQDPDSLASLPYLPFGQAEFELLMWVGRDAIDFDEISFGSYHYGADDIHETSTRLSIQQKCRDEVLSSIALNGGQEYTCYSNLSPIMQDIPQMLPRLVARAEQAGFRWNA